MPSESYKFILKEKKYHASKIVNKFANEIGGNSLIRGSMIYGMAVKCTYSTNEIYSYIESFSNISCWGLNVSAIMGFQKYSIQYTFLHKNFW